MDGGSQICDGPTSRPAIFVFQNLASAAAQTRLEAKLVLAKLHIVSCALVLASFAGKQTNGCPHAC